MKTNNELHATFLQLINNVPVHRFDVLRDGVTKNVRDYAYGKGHYSIGNDFKAEVTFTDKTEQVIKGVVIKNKTFNTIVADFQSAEHMASIAHALDTRVLTSRVAGAKGIQQQAELNRLANAR